MRERRRNKGGREGGTKGDEGEKEEQRGMRERRKNKGGREGGTKGERERRRNK